MSSSDLALIKIIVIINEFTYLRIFVYIFDNKTRFKTNSETIILWCVWILEFFTLKSGKYTPESKTRKCKGL